MKGTEIRLLYSVVIFKTLYFLLLLKWIIYFNRESKRERR